MRKLISKVWGFSFVGVVATLISVALIYLGNEILNLNKYVTYTIAYMASLFISYLLNFTFTFKTGKSLVSALAYFSSYLVIMGIGVLALRILEATLPDLNASIQTMMVLPFTALSNFIMVNMIVSRTTEEKYF